MLGGEVVGDCIAHLLTLIDLLLHTVRPVMQLTDLPVVLVHPVLLSFINPLPQLIHVFIELLTLPFVFFFDHCNLHLRHTDTFVMVSNG